MHISFQEYVIAFTGTSLHIFVAFLLFKRGIFRQFPFFTTYTIFEIATEIVLIAELLGRASSLKYAYTYYSLQTAAIGLSFCVIFEIFKTVLEPYDAFKRVWRVLFLSAAALLILMSLAWLIFGAGATSDRMTQTMNLLLRSLRLIQVGLLLILFAFSSSVGLTWRSYSFGLAFGYGTYATVDLVFAAMRLQYGDQVWQLQSLLSTVAYIVMILIWICYILQSHAVAQPARIIPHNDIEKWNEKLEELLKRKSA